MLASFLEFTRFDGHFSLDEGVWFSCRERGTRTLRNSGEKMIAVVRTGRSDESLAQEYQPCAVTIHEWVRQAAAGDSDEPGSLTDCASFGAR